MRDHFWHKLRDALVYLVLSIFIILWQLLPSSDPMIMWPYPNLLLLMSIGWAIYSEEGIPLGLTIFVFLLCDLILEKPMGASALMAVIIIEWLRWRARDMREMPFLLTWLIVAGAIIFMVSGQLLILLLLMGEVTFFPIMARQTAVDLAVYPVFVLVFKVFQRQRKETQKDPNTLV